MLLPAWSICALPFPWHHGARVGEAAHPGPITSAVDAGVVLPPEDIWDPWDPRIDELINAPPSRGAVIGMAGGVPPVQVPQEVSMAAAYFLPEPLHPACPPVPPPLSGWDALERRFGLKFTEPSDSDLVLIFSRLVQ